MGVYWTLKRKHVDAERWMKSKLYEQNEKARIKEGSRRVAV
jgi:hypothetical protein